MLDGSICASDKQNEVGTTVETKSNTVKRHLCDDVDGKFANTVEPLLMNTRVLSIPYRHIL